MICYCIFVSVYVEIKLVDNVMNGTRSLHNIRVAITITLHNTHGPGRTHDNEKRNLD